MIYLAADVAAAPTSATAAPAAPKVRASSSRATGRGIAALLLLVPAMAVALLTNQEIFNAYLVWADQHFAADLLRHDIADQLDDHASTRR